VVTAFIGDHGGMSDDRGPAQGDAPAQGDPDEVRPTGRPNARLRQTVTDMVRSLALVLAAIGVILLITWRPGPDPVKVVDPTPPLTQARIEAGYPVVYPEALTSAWRTTSARWEVTEASVPEPAWHVGFVTPAQAFAQLRQSATADPDFIQDVVGRTQPSGEWEGWMRYEVRNERALVKVVDGVTIIVSGTAEWSELQELAQRLNPTALPGID
jgi:hypothetical protein